MDADIADVDSNDLLSLFDLSPEAFPWREPCPQEIEARRVQLSGQLVFDIVLSAGGLHDPRTLWPPTDAASLQRLLDAIQTSTYDSLKRDCLVYYLLKWHQDGREDAFKEERCIPPQFSALSDAYWFLDTGLDIPRAVSLLSDIRLSRDYTSKVIQAISLAEDASPLIIKFIRTVVPPVAKHEDIDAYIEALAQISFMEAWFFQRTFPEQNEMRKHLVLKVVEWCLSPSPRPEPLKQLLSLPFTHFEQEIVHNLALEPPPTLPANSLPVLQDLICVRLIQSGQYAQAVSLDRKFAGSAHGHRALKAAEDRRNMVEAALAVLPSVERLLVEEELAAHGQPRAWLTPMSTPARLKSLSTSNGVDAEISVSDENHPPAQTTVDSPSTSVTRPFIIGRPSPRVAATVAALADASASNSPRKMDSFTMSSRILLDSTPTSAPSASIIPNLNSLTAQTSPPTIPLSKSMRTPVISPSGLRPSVHTTRFPAAQRNPTSASVAYISSLFENNNAKSHRNAFYNPTQLSKQDSFLSEPTTVLDTLLEESQATETEDDVEMLLANGEQGGEQTVTDLLSQRATSEHDAEEEERPTTPPRSDVFDRSLFESQMSDDEQLTQPASELFSPGGFRNITRNESELETEHELESVPESRHDTESEQEPERISPRPRRPSPTPPPVTPRQLRQTRSSHAAARNDDTTSASENTRQNRTIPGGFFAEADADEDEDAVAEEQADEVAPLPLVSPVKRPRRRSRSARSSVEREDITTPVRPRRSSRLSNASTRSSSPEPLSPQKISTTSAGTTRKTRASASVTTSSTRSSTRKKR